MTIRSALIAAGCASLTASTSLANPIDAFGFGGRAPAMAGAQTAAATDTSANYYNPALLSQFENVRVDVTYHFSDLNLELSGNDLGVDSSRGTAIGLAVPGHVGPAKVAISGAFYLPDQHFARTRALKGSQPRFQLYDNRPQRFLMSANIATQIGDWLAIGGGITYMSGTRGTLTLDGRVGFPDAADSDLDLAIDMDVRTIQYPQFGIWVKAAEWLSFGASYRGQFQLQLEQIVDIRGDVGTEGMEPVVEDGFFTFESLAKDLFQPRQITLGAAAHPVPELTLSADISFHKWSAFQNPATLISIDLDVGEFNDQIMIAENPANPEANFADIIVTRLGGEYTATRDKHLTIAARAGYSYEPSPAPEQTGETNFVDGDKHTVSVGVGATFRDITHILPLPFSIDAFFALTTIPERIHKKTDPVDPIGDYTSSGRIFQFGLGTQWQF